MYTLEQIGFDQRIKDLLNSHEYRNLEIGRISAEHKERYWLISDKGDFEGEITGNLRFAAKSRADFPAVGDWVTYMPFETNKVIIQDILPRKTVLERQSVNRYGESQIIATNIDTAFIVMAVDRDFSINRAERYITLCNSANILPVIICNKTDLISENQLSEIIAQLKSRTTSLQIITTSCIDKSGIKTLKDIISPAQTYCLLGSSGVGKSTILNLLKGSEHMDTRHISESTNRGKHTTTHRELVVLPGGGILIDNPGMREVGIADTSDGVDQTFSHISELAKKCRFSNCQHINEKGCAVIEAVDNGEISEESYQNYLKLEREKEHFQATVADKRKKDKQFGKMVKHYKNIKKKNQE